MDQKIKIGIVGIGGYGRLLLNLLLEEEVLDSACVEVAVVRSPERSVEHLDFLKSHAPDVKVFQTLEKVIESGVELDLMILPVGIDSHREMTEMALKAGWNVMVEKPLAGSAEDAEAMIRAEETSGRFAAVGFQDMYGRWAPAMKQTLLSGAIGEISSIRVFGIWGRSVEYYQRNTWAGKLVHDGSVIYDSPFNNAMAHYLNLALFLAGADEGSSAMPISVEGSLWRAHDIEACDTAHLNWTTAEGPDVSVFFSHTSSDNIHPELVVTGSRGVLRWQFNSHWEVCVDGQDPVRHNIPAPPEFRRAMIRQLIEKVRHPDTSVYTMPQALSQVQASCLAHETLPIQDIDADLITHSMTRDDAGNEQNWLCVSGLEEAGRRFLAGESITLFAPEEHGALTV